jgi:hypothetical protein
MNFSADISVSVMNVIGIFITEIEKSTLKFIWKYKRSRIAKAILNKKEQHRRYHNNQRQTILQSIPIKTAWYYHKYRYTDQWNRIENQDMNPYSYAHLIFNKGAKNMMEKR